MTFTARSLGDICNDVKGQIRTGPFGSQLHESDYVSDGIPVVMPKDIVPSGISIASIARINELEALRLSAHRLHKGDIVYGRRGDIGRQALITKREDGWICGTGCLRISLGGSIVNPQFLHYYLSDQNVIREISNQAVGATMPNLNTSILRGVVINYPSLPIQRKIAGILSAYDDLIENNQRRIRILEEMAQAIYREWFVEFRYPGYRNATILTTERGKIPNDWELLRLGDLVSTQYGHTASANTTVVGPKFLRGMDINKYSYIDWRSVPYCSAVGLNFEKYKLRCGDILVIRMADPGKVAIVESDVESVFASYLVRLAIVSDKLEPYYLFYFLMSDEYQNYIRGASGGTTRASASAPVITGIDLRVPPKAIIREFSNIIGPIRSQVTALVAKNAILRQTRDLLLPKLISGELDVSNLDIAIREPN